VRGKPVSRFILYKYLIIGEIKP
jgi:hypothetical protein